MQRDHINRHIGQRLRQRRWMLGMNQNQLGKAVGVGLQQIHKYETGISQISASRLWHIAAVIGCDIAYFFEGLDEGSPGAGLSREEGAAGRQTLTGPA